MLVSVGLDVDEVHDIALRALAEDLRPDGVDVTSAATIPAEQADTAELVAPSRRHASTMTTSTERPIR
jgi:nicotinate-nucleotide pyrophosphorylase (carboxylating)